MPRRITLPDHLPVEELEHRYRAAHDPVARSHWHILWLLARGTLTRQVADLTGYSIAWIHTIAARYRHGGPDAVGDHRHGNPGRGDHRLLSPELAEGLRLRLASPAPDGGLWTGRKVAAWLSDRLGRPVSPQRGWEALRALGFTPQRPRPTATRADPAAQQAFKKGGSKPRSMPSPPPIQMP